MLFMIITMIHDHGNDDGDVDGNDDGDNDGGFGDCNVSEAW